MLCRTQASKLNFHERVLKAWYEERKQQLEKSLASTIENGRFVTESNPFKILMRNVYLWFVHLIPSWRHELSLGRRKDGMVRYKYADGFPFLPEYNGGLCLPQVYCRPLGTPKGDVCFTDDVIFAPGKKGIFQLLVYVKNLGEVPLARDIVADIDDMSHGEIFAAEATFLVEYMAINETDELQNIFCLASAEEFAQSRLCSQRPKPEFYDHLYLGKELGGMRFTVVRPDRFIFGSCDTRQDLRKVAEAASSCLGQLL